MAKISKADIAIIGYSIAAGAGVDVILTGIANAVVPTAFGLPGLVQKVCIKAATIGLSFVAVDAMDKCIRTTASEIAQSIEEELKKESPR